MNQSFDNLTYIENHYSELKSKGLDLDLTRGKPHSGQLDLTNNLDGILSGSCNFGDLDIRNYGEIKGLRGCRELGAKILECPVEYVIAGGNSSLTLMSQYLMSLFLHGSGKGPWLSYDRVSFLCPVPGYDRHFKLCEEFGINMIPIPLTGNGPDISYVKKIVKKDPSIQGIWCVPKHSNPTGDIYSKECIEGLLEVCQLAKGDFKILWDNAYAVHDFYPSQPLPDIFKIAGKSNSLEAVIAFASTSKITFAGGGVSFIAMSERNLDIFLKHYSSITIGPDKVNQARHIMFFKGYEDLLIHMKKHAEILRPKFEIVEKWLSLQNYGSWTKPSGGYFVSFNTNPGLAKETIQLASEVGLKLTPAGSTYPYGVDPHDENIRIAPTACSEIELEEAMETFVVCVALAALRRKV